MRRSNDPLPYTPGSKILPAGTQVLANPAPAQFLPRTRGHKFLTWHFRKQPPLPSGQNSSFGLNCSTFSTMRILLIRASSTTPTEPSPAALEATTRIVRNSGKLLQPDLSEHGTSSAKRTG